MKPVFYFMLMAVMACACTTAKKTTKTSAVVKQMSTDSLEYELTIIDLYFDQWYNLNYSPAKDLTEEYYRAKNLVGVSNWNQFYNMRQYDRVIDSYIDYHPEIDYGMALDRKLYWYFKYVSTTYGIPLFN